jgi:ABC-type branched-subunit amino acid transport system permease subunit
VVWPLALIAAARWPAWSFGFLALRTSGVQFIMITLAFGQMVYFMLPVAASVLWRRRRPVHSLQRNEVAARLLDMNRPMRPSTTSAWRSP